MKLAFLYAGQGSQRAGMGADLYTACSPFQKAFDCAVSGLSFDCKEICFADKNGIIGQTEYTQPCMVAFAVGVTAALRAQGVVPDVAAGLSLGEYSALYAAGAFDEKTVVSVVATRGQAMAQAAQGVLCGMAAVLGLDAKTLADCCAQIQVSTGEVVQICNYNCPGQLVIGGHADAVAACSALAKEQGAKRCLPLKVSGAFHTALMQPAGDVLETLFQTVPIAALQIPVLFNTLGREWQDGDADVASLLVRQVQSSVKMEDILRRLVELGVDTVVEIGPGKALSGFLKKTVGTQITCYSIETMADLQAAVLALKGV